MIPTTDFYICDIRPEWRSKWAITFWRPDNAGYAFPLCWSGKYDAKTVIEGGDYYATRAGNALIRFPVPCEVADSLGVSPPSGKIDGDAGPVVLNSGQNRIKLRKAGRAAIAALAPFTEKES
jgi:hypothetical protein